MNREIKFRAFDGVDYLTKPFTLLDVQNGKIQLASSDTIINQYTGLKDKNGNDIYEGDILTFTHTKVKSVFAIKWMEKDAAYTLFAPKDHVEIIGNIYQNPELLENNKI